MSLPRIPTRDVDAKKQMTRMAESINGLIDGRADVTGTLTLDASATTTIVADNKFESTMVPILIPLTANAAAELPTLYLSDRTEGAFELTHTNAVSTDRTFAYVRLG